MNMSKNNKKNEGFAPMIPPIPMPFIPNFGNWAKPEVKSYDKKIIVFMDDCDANVMALWKQIIDMQKSYIESSKGQWQQFIDKLFEMQDSFANSLPEEFPVAPGMKSLPVTPKYLMDQLKQFEEMSNDYFTEQADSCADFCIKSQEQTRDVVSTIAEKASDLRQEEANADEAESAPAKKKATSKKKAAQTEEAKSAPPKKKATPKKKTEATEKVKPEPTVE